MGYLRYSKTIFITSGTSYKLPFDFNVNDNLIECYAAGAPGLNYTGGGGGAYAAGLNLKVFGGTTVSIGIGDPGGITNTYFNATSLANAIANGVLISCGAQGGHYTDQTGVGSGGTAANSVGTTVYSGGDGGQAGYYTGSGGGGCAGPNGNGAKGGPGGPRGGGGGGGGGANGGFVGNPSTGRGGNGYGGNGYGGTGGGSGDGITGTGAGGAGCPANGYAAFQGALDDSIYADGVHGPGGGGGGSGDLLTTGGSSNGYGAGGGGVSSYPGYGGAGTAGFIAVSYNLISPGAQFLGL